MSKELTKSQIRKKFGHAKSPLKGTRVLSRKMGHDFGTPAHAILVLNEDAGTVTSANVYGGNLGKNYDAETMTNPLPKGEELQAWIDGKCDSKLAKKGKQYAFSTEDFGGTVEIIKAKVKVAAPKAKVAVKA
jgi:hypothetical protein